MTTYERIIALIKSWRTPIVRDKDLDYAACIYQKDGNVCIAGWVDDINDVYEYINTIRTKEEIEGVNREIVRIDSPERITYKEWDLVDLDIDALEKTYDWKFYKEGFWDWKWLIIKKMFNELQWVVYSIYTKNKTNYFAIWSEYLLPHNPQENKTTLSDEELLEELRKRNLLVNKEVVK